MERRASPPGRTGETPGAPLRNKLFCCCRFFIYDDLQVRGHILVQLDGDDELADGLERFVQLDLPAIDVETLLLKRFGNVASRHRSKQVIAFAGLAQELHLE